MSLATNEWKLAWLTVGEPAKKFCIERRTSRKPSKSLWSFWLRFWVRCSNSILIRACSHRLVWKKRATTTAKVKAIGSVTESLRRQSAARKVQIRTSGAKIRVPIESPTYQVSQFVKKSAEEITRANQRVVTAKVEVMRQLDDATREKRATSFSVASAVRMPTKRRTRNAPARACKAAAPAIKAGTVTDFTIPPKVAVSSDVQKWTRKDPMITPGQARLPNRRIQPSARPAAGQTAVA